MTRTAALPVGIEDVRAARELLQGVSRTTPMEGLRGLSATVGGPVLLKCENLQRTGSFKIRGAYVRIARLTDAERARGVVAASAGNHAQGVALAASLLGCASTVFMPETAPLPKVAATKAYGAQVRLHGHTVDEALVAARAFAEETGAVLIHPFDHVDIVAGQGTVGLEIAEQCPDVRTVVVCTGGGGLVAGIAVAIKALLPRRARRRRAGRGRRVVGPVARRRPARSRWSRCRRWPTASPSAARARCPSRWCRSCRRRRARRRGGAVAGAAALPGARQARRRARRRRGAAPPSWTRPATFEPPVVAVLSGGNVDPLLLPKVVRHGLVAAGRFLVAAGARSPTGRASWRGCWACWPPTRANVLDVEHSRTGAGLHSTRWRWRCGSRRAARSTGAVPPAADEVHQRPDGRRLRPSAQRLPRRSCSRSIASNSALKLPLPKPSEPCRSMSSKNTVGRSCTGLVKICSR